MIYGLLHVQPDEASAHNVRIASFQDQIELYLRNAATLAASLRMHGLDYTLLTNDKTRLDALARRLGRAVDIVQIPCTLAVPSGLKFYSAHFKIDALKYLAAAADDYAMLCDLDVVCLHPMPQSLKQLVSRKMPLFYDISDQVIAAYGHQVIIDDLSSISGTRSPGRWAGGEFIGGPPAFFSRLHQVIEQLWPRYLSLAHTLHHIGDEAIVSAALERMVAGGEVIGDAGTLGIVGRFWSGTIRHSQRPLAHYRTHFLLHLPADKRLLGELDPDALPRFFTRYAAYLRKKRLRNLASTVVRALRRR